MTTSIKSTGNVGEWSELYTLAYLLVHGGAFAGDERQSPIKDIYYKVLEIFLAEKEAPKGLHYKILSKEILMFSAGSEIGSLSKENLKSHMEVFFTDLVNKNHKKTFHLDSGLQLMELMKRKTMSASSGEQQSDLEVVLEDEETKVPSPKVGFNIKSQLGGASTLLNSSGATNFVYRVVPNDPLVRGPYPEFTHGRHRINLLALRESGYHLEFHEISSSNFQTNLKFLDLTFPDNLAKVLLAYYETKFNKFSDVVEHVFPIADPNSRFAVFKLKEFLGAVSMGMRPAGEWDGNTTKFRGLLVVKTTGEIVFYYLHNRNQFQEYLYENVKFDRPDTKRHKYGVIYSDQGQDFIKLNLQIRFRK